MEQKDIQTALSQTEQQQMAFKNLVFFKEEKKSDFILQHFLKNYNEEEIDSRNKLARVKNTLQDQLDNFSLAQRSHFRKYLVSDQLKKYLEYFCGENVIDDNSLCKNQKLYALKDTYISFLKSKIEQLLIRIKSWREQKANLLQRKKKELRANLLIYKQYNIKNYLQQLLLIKDLITRVNKIFSQKVPDIRHLQELVGKRGVPYYFYKKYCLNNCCKAISMRTKEQNLTMLIQSASNLQLVQYMKKYFFDHKTLYQKCCILLTFAKFIRITSHNTLSVQNGFILAFRPYFIESLKESNNVESMEYLKSRSIMQSNEETIDIWLEFQQIKLQRYCLWYYDQMNLLKRHELLHIKGIKQTLQQYKSNYAWINQIQLKSNKIHGNRNFNEVFIKNVLCIIIKPILVHLYFYKVPLQKIKKMQKYRNEYNLYWIYWLFRSYTKLYRFLRDKIKQLVQSLINTQKFTSFEQGELNPTQYYMYYEQISEIISIYLKQRAISQQFYDFWKNIIVKISTSFLKQKNKIEIIKKIDEQMQFQRFLQNEENLLGELIKNRKRLDSQYFLETLFIKVTKLNFNTSNYFLLHEAIKLLNKENQKELQLIRQVAYQQFYK